jgi:hypothetical protein
MPKFRQSWRAIAMRYDPILEEVHRIKDEIADEYNGDVRKLLADLARTGQSSDGGELIRSPEGLRVWADAQTNEPTTTSSS